MKVLILGGSGMLGHKLWQTFAPRFDTYVTFRGDLAEYERLGIFDMSRSFGGLDAENIDGFARVLSDVRPSAVINCIGIVKQDAAAHDPIASISVNSLFPHRLARLCAKQGARMIHLSTDCVFSGRQGNYSELDPPDPQDLYGRSKLLGEISGDKCLTIRTSMIGRELSGSHGLLEWFLSQTNKSVKGFKRAIFSGFTTVALAEIIGDLIANHQELSNIWHVAAQPISKFDLLTLVKQAYHLNIDIQADEEFVCDRSLNGEQFRGATGSIPPSWPQLIDRLCADSTRYEDLRRTDVQR